MSLANIYSLLHALYWSVEVRCSGVVEGPEVIILNLDMETQITLGYLSSGDHRALVREHGRERQEPPPVLRSDVRGTRGGNVQLLSLFASWRE